MKRIPLKGGDEFDALTKARKFYCYLARAGAAKKVKRAYNKRFRRIAKNETSKAISAAADDVSDNTNS